MRDSTAGEHERGLARLGDLEDFRVAKDGTDPRGWHLVLADGVKVGKVRELIVDTAAMEARYLDCDVDEKKLKLEPIDRHVLVPVDHVRLDRDKKEAVVDGMASPALTDYPVYSGLPLTEDARRGMDRVLGPRRTAVRDDDRIPDGDRTRYETRSREISDDPHERVVREQPRDRVDVEPDRTERQHATLRTSDQEVRIRLAGDDVIIEKRPLKEDR